MRCVKHAKIQSDDRQRQPVPAEPIARGASRGRSISTPANRIDSGCCCAHTSWRTLVGDPPLTMYSPPWMKTARPSRRQSLFWRDCGLRAENPDSGMYAAGCLLAVCADRMDAFAPLRAKPGIARAWRAFGHAAGQHVRETNVATSPVAAN